MMPYFYYGYGAPGGIFMILFGVLLLLFLFWLFSGYRDRTFRMDQFRHDGTDQDTATKILRERYAKGEINKSEFDEKMKDLKDASNK
jgi:putative membrane protein